MNHTKMLHDLEYLISGLVEKKVENADTDCAVAEWLNITKAAEILSDELRHCPNCAANAASLEKLLLQLGEWKEKHISIFPPSDQKENESDEDDNIFMRTVSFYGHLPK